MSFQLNVKKLSPSATIPSYGSDMAAGLDIAASEAVQIMPRSRAVVGTGIAIEFYGPNATNYYLRIAPRSGLSVKKCIDIGAGVVDYDYRGEVKICVINNSDTVFDINVGDKVAQMILERINRFDLIQEVTTLSETIRGSNGFGSTGINAVTDSINTLSLSS
jgi:dUTP pyrophosphatase